MVVRSKPLSVREVYLAHRLGLSLIHSTRSYVKDVNGAWVRPSRKRPASEVRKILKVRRDNWKYPKAREAWVKMADAVSDKDFDAFHRAIWDCRDALKYKGYIQFKQMLEELRIEGMSDKQIKKQMVIDSIEKQTEEMEVFA